MTDREDILRIVDEMIEVGQLVFRPDIGIVDIADRANFDRVYALSQLNPGRNYSLQPRHRRRPTLLRQPGYVAWRARAAGDAS